MKSHIILILFSLILLSLACTKKRIKAPQETDVFEKILICSEFSEGGSNYLEENSYFIDGVLVDSVAFAQSLSTKKIKYSWKERIFENFEIIDSININGRLIKRYAITIINNAISNEKYKEDQSQIDNLDVHINHIGLVGVAVNHTIVGIQNLNIGLYNKLTGERILSFSKKDFSGKFYRLSYSDRLNPTTDVRAVVIIGDEMAYQDFTLVQHARKPGTIENTLHAEQHRLNY